MPEMLPIWRDANHLALYIDKCASGASGDVRELFAWYYLAIAHKRVEENRSRGEVQALR
jgi:hypothetical protein